MQRSAMSFLGYPRVTDSPYKSYGYDQNILHSLACLNLLPSLGLFPFFGFISCIFQILSR
jgi:hypothetical protein